MQLELNEVQAYLINVNPRAEIHGEEKKPACDLKIRTDLGNDYLAMFHPTLKSMLFHYDKHADADLVDEAQKGDKNYLPHLRFKNIPSLKLTDECIGASVVIHQGIPGEGLNSHDIKLELCNVNSFHIEPKQGGTCTITFRVQCHPEELDFGKLCAIIGTTIRLSVVPPEAVTGD